MGYTYQLPGEKTITLKDRISQIEVARFGDRAPDLWSEVTDVLLNREQWENEDSPFSHDEDEGASEASRRAMRKQVMVSFELTGHSVDALKALIDFCVAVTDSVSGFEDADGEPAVWKHMSDAEKQELYEMDVTSGRMVTIYLDCWAHKNGLIDLNDTGE
jgi:hypothetical protein